MKALVFIIMLALASAVLAVPQLINYQGELTDPSGTPLDTTVAMTFKIYGVSNGGSAIWTETHPSVAVVSGLFDVSLGSITGLFDTFSANRWLGVTVGSNSEMTPREQIVSVAHAFRVGTVDGSSGGVISGKLNIGEDNTNNGDFAFVNGSGNFINGNYATILNGTMNVADSNYAFIGTGSGNVVSGSYSVVGGGRFNRVRNSYSVICGGGSTLTLDSNRIVSTSSFIGGGFNNYIQATNSAIVCGNGNGCLGSEAFIGGGRSNSTYGELASVCGGFQNSASDLGFVGGGSGNSSYGINSGVGGGDSNFAGKGCSFVGGGRNNRIPQAGDGDYSAILGGDSNTVTGNHTMAMGTRINATANNSFVFSDGSGAIFSPGVSNTFNAKASGGVRFYSNTAATIGAQLQTGQSAWTAICDSTKKDRFGRVNTQEILEKVSKLGIETWSYKDDPTHTTHIGPMAQDFYAQFRVGESDTTISTLDPDGVALAAIQELAKENIEKDKKIADLEARMKLMEAAILQFGTLNKSDKQ